MNRVAFCLVLALLPSCFVARFYATDWPPPVETCQVHTLDGWTLDLKHVPPLAGPRRARPVILMHGIETDGRFMDLDERHSLALYLARQGFDVWVPSLRDTGASERQPRAPVNFDDYVDFDAPAIVHYVRAHTGGGPVDWVGHSMGGMILYAYLSSGGTGIGRGVTLGSPVRLQWTGAFEKLMRRISPLAPYASWAPVEAAAHMTLPLQGSGIDPAERIILGPATTAQTFRRLVAVAIDEAPAGVVAQFADWVLHNRFDSRDHRIDYLRGLSKVRIPMLVVAGKIDGIAPPWAVRPAFETLASPVKRWIVLGRANGASTDYNHVDLVLGEHAAADLWRTLVAFLAS